MRAGPVSANHTAMFSFSARKISLRCFLACPRSTFLLSAVRTDLNLFDLIPAGSGFLTVAKSHPIVSQYWEDNYSSDQEICYEILLVLAFLSVSAAAYEEITLPNGDVPFLSYSGIRVAEAKTCRLKSVP